MHAEGGMVTRLVPAHMQEFATTHSPFIFVHICALNRHRYACCAEMCIETVSCKPPNMACGPIGDVELLPSAFVVL